MESGRAPNVRPIPDNSNAFLHRIERQRLDSECLRPLDLRPHARGPCKRFSYRGRSLWLDQESRNVFLEGLSNNAGVFTVETYESIIRQFVGEAINSEQVSNEEVFPKKDGEPLVETTKATSSSSLSGGDYNKQTIDLSYFKKRHDVRVKINLNLELIWREKSYAAQTRDISKSGLQLRLKSSIDASINDIVRVNVAPLADRQLEQPELLYRVVRVRHLLHDTLLGLQCIENDVKDGLLAISDHTATSSQAALTEQRDPEDALLTAQALLAERFYMRSTSVVPFFMFECLEDGSPLRIIFGNQVNQRHLDAFRNPQGCYDFSSLVTPRRIKLLTRLALRDSKADTLIAVYRSHEHSEPQVIADLECKNHKHWHRLLKRYADQPEFRVFKIVARLAHQPVKMRIENALEPFTDKSGECVEKLLDITKTLSVVGAFINVTEEISNWIKDSCCHDLNSHEDRIICCDKERPLAPPQLVSIHYIQENRSEDRHLGRMHVELDIAGRLYQGVTRDISAHGLSIVVESTNIAISNERLATISFPKLDANSSSLTRFQRIFRDVPVELVSGPDDGEQLLRFKIRDVTKGHQFSKAFSGILAKHQSGLSLDTSHILRTATSRLYSSFFIESSSTLPLFIYRNAHGDWHSRFGETTYPTPLIDFFEVANGKYDFSFLSNSGRLNRIIQQLSASGSSELTLYLCKERHKDAPSFSIQSLADFEISDETTRREFVHHAMDHDFRCVKVIVTQPKVPPTAEINQAIDRLAQLSPSKCERLKNEFDSLVAIGDVVDITGPVVECWSEEPVVTY